MTYPNVAGLFDFLDRWRHLPAYQLERRADIFFGLFLPEVLSRHLRQRNIEIDPHLIPEFPLGQGGSKRSDKADYFALSIDRKHAFLIELKTDLRSRRPSQDDYLCRAKARGLNCLLHDLRDIAKATNVQARRKYFHLLQAVADLGLMKLPFRLEDKIFCDGNPRGVYKLIESIEIVPDLPSLEVIHVLPAIPPKGSDGMDIIDFPFFADVVEPSGEIGARFADSLCKWSNVRPGERPQ